MRKNQNNMTTKEIIVGTIWVLILASMTIIGVKIVVNAYLYGIDKTIENQDVMLCEAALVSGNEEYQEKCSCYYTTDNIKCLQQ